MSEARARIRSAADLNAFISLTREDGEGTIVGVKDLVDVRATITTGGGRIMNAEPTTDDAPVITSIRQHGCVVVGKTNLHE